MLSSRVAREERLYRHFVSWSKNQKSFLESGELLNGLIGAIRSASGSAVPSFVRQGIMYLCQFVPGAQAPGQTKYGPFRVPNLNVFVVVSAKPRCCALQEDLEQAREACSGARCSRHELLARHGVPWTSLLLEDH